MTVDDGVLGTSRCVPSEMTLMGSLARTSTPTQWLLYTMLPSTCTYNVMTRGVTGAGRVLTGANTCLQVRGKLVSPSALSPPMRGFGYCTESLIFNPNQSPLSK